jgi:hypothetical protein
MHDDPSRPPEDAGRDRPTADTEQDLRATSDAIKVDIGRLATIEDEKMALDPRDPRVDGLSDQAVALADRIARETRAERQLSDELG